MKQILYMSSFLFVTFGVLTGCGGSSSGGNSNLPTTQIQARLIRSGVTSAWPQAAVYGNALPYQYNCDPNADPNCYTSGQGTADGNGNYLLSTNAIPGIWDIGAKADSYCELGSSSSNVQLSPAVPNQLYCGAINGVVSNLSPNSCSLNTYLDGSSDTDCPSTITATIDRSAFPTTHAMNVSTYTEGGTSLSSQSLTANSSTTLVLPTPLRQGDNIVVIRDPSNNRVLLSGLFTYTVTRQHCTPDTC